MLRKAFTILLGFLLVFTLIACKAPAPAAPTEFVIGPCDNILLGGTNKEYVEFSVDPDSSVLFLRADFTPKDSRYRESDFLFEAEKDWELTLERDGQYFSEFTLYTAASDVADWDDFTKNYLAPYKQLTQSCSADQNTIKIPYIYNGEMVTRVDCRVFMSNGTWSTFVVFNADTN